MSVKLSASVFALILAVNLSACSSTTRPRSPSPFPSTLSSTVSLTKAKLTAQARSGLVDYFHTLSKIYNRGGAGVEELKPLVTAKRYEEEVDSAAYSRKAGTKVKGPVTVASFEVQQADPRSEVVTAYVCVDLSKTRIISSGGRDETPKDRVDMQSLSISFKSSNLIDTIEPWSGQNLC